MDNYPERLRTLFEAKGQAALVVDGVCWINYRSMAEPRSPIFKEVNINKKEAVSIRKKLDCRLIRWYSLPQERPATDQEWYVVICRKVQSLETLKSKDRKKREKALDLTEVKSISIDFMIEQGYGLYRKAFEKYQGGNTQSKVDFQNELKVEIDFSDLISYLGIFVSGQFCGYSKHYLLGPEILVAVTKFDPAFLAKRIGDALTMERQRIFIAEGNHDYIRSGFRNLEHQTNYQDFLVKNFEYEKLPLDLNIQYSPALALSKPIWKTGSKILGQRMPGLSALSKMDQYRKQ